MRINRLSKGINFINSIFQWCSRQYKQVGADEFFYRLSGLCLPVFDALRLIKNNHIRHYLSLNILDIEQNLFVINEIKKGSLLILLQTIGAISLNDQAILTSKFGNLFLPFRF